MQLKKIALTDTRSFSSFFLDYIQQKETLKKFYNRLPTPDQFEHQIKEKSASFTEENRKVLKDVLGNQYKNLKTSDLVIQNITSLGNAKTFTITTGHQLNIFTGPLYFIFKIVTVINTCKKLKELYPAYNFIPVYWMASEDHDYEEIKYFRLYGKKYVWETNQHGAVGRFNTSDITKLLNEIPGDTTIFRNAYTKHNKLSDAVRYYVNELFQQEGLVVLDADDRSLKSLFKDVIKDDIINHSTKRWVDATDKELSELGYKTQVHCRDINFFYLEDGLRSRIEKQGDLYKVIDTDLTFTLDELTKCIEDSPDKFSPNVILRPLYQEMILPNLAYIGGPAEVIYWLQLRQVFNHFKVPYPIIMPRNFGMIIDHQVERKMEKTKLDLKDFFDDKHNLFKHWVLKNSNHNLSVNEERASINKVFEQLKSNASIIDQTLLAYVNAEEKRTLSRIESIERKMLRAEKRLYEDKLRQIEFIKDTLFPNGSLQERVDNFLNFYQQDSQFINNILSCFDPFDFQFNILMLA